MDATSRLSTAAGGVRAEPAARDEHGVRTGWRVLDRLVVDAQAVTVSELAALLGAVALGALATSSLALAHLHHYTLGNAAVAWAAAVLVMGGLVGLAGPLPAVVLDPPRLPAAVGAGLVPLVMLRP